MMPNKDTEFKPIGELVNYSDKEKYFCDAVVFSPETENNHFEGCPPYIRINHVNDFDADDIFFEIPEIVAYYAKTHPRYTIQGKRDDIKKGRKEMARDIKKLLDIA